MGEQSRGEFLTDLELGAWHGMLSLHARIIGELDRRLRAGHGLSVSEFDVLITLYNAPDGGWRMTDLANAVMLSSGGLTQLVTRLERDRLVARRLDSIDRRSYRVSLTGPGRSRLDDARATHNEVIRTGFTDRLSPRQLRELGRLYATALEG